MVIVYQPRFEGRERYGFTAFTVRCPELDSTLLDLQRFPGKVCAWGRERERERDKKI